MTTLRLVAEDPDEERPHFYLGKRVTHTVRDDQGHWVASGSTAEDAALRAADKVADQHPSVKAARESYLAMRRDYVAHVAAEILATAK